MTSLIQRLLRQRASFRSLEEEVWVGLQLVADRLTEPWARTLRERADLTLIQYNVLRILRGSHETGLRASEIAERLVTRAPDVTRILDRLQARGLVTREPDPDDRRAVRVRITAGGLERIAPLDEASAESLAEHLRPLGEERLRELRDTLDRILALLPRQG